MEGSLFILIWALFKFLKKIIIFKKLQIFNHMIDQNLKQLYISKL